MQAITGRFPSRVFQAIAAAVLGVMACATEPCTCPPAASYFVVYGTVLTAGNAPSAGASVAVDISTSNCVFETGGTLFATATTSADGRFRTTPSLGAAGTSGCMRVTARTADDIPGTGVIEAVLMEFPRAPGTIDSMGVVIRLR